MQQQAFIFKVREQGINENHQDPLYQSSAYNSHRSVATSAL